MTLNFYKTCNGHLQSKNGYFKFMPQYYKNTDAIILLIMSALSM